MSGERTPAEARRVIVVDDDRDGAVALSAVIALEGFAVRTVFDGLNALPAIEAWQPHCVVLDIDLPGMDGFDIARRLRRRPLPAPALLIATSGWTRPQDVETAAVCGIDHFLAKPLDLPKLLALLPRG